MQSHLELVASPASNHSSPCSLPEYDPDHGLDSGGSSSGDHSSPSSDSAHHPSSPVGTQWAYELGFAAPPLSAFAFLPSGITTSDRRATPIEPMFGAAVKAHEPDFADPGAMGGIDESNLSLGSDFWSTAPTAFTGSPAASPYHGTSTVPSPASAVPEPASAHPPSLYSATTASSSVSATFPSSPVFSNSRSLAPDQLTLDHGIAPEMTGGIPSPPLTSRSSSTQGHPSLPTVAPSTVQPILIKQEETCSREPSETRKPEDLFQLPSTNLVSKEAVIASNFITSVLDVLPSALLPHTNPLQLLVLGVPVAGAKSRVETQIKISLVLVTPKAGCQPVQLEDGVPPESIMTIDGGLDSSVDDALLRVGSWGHIRLPSHLALKRKSKKQVKPDPDPGDTLFLDVAVHHGTEPYQEVTICPGCQQREHKRALRKKDSKRSSNEMAGIQFEEDESKKVIVFNCPDVVEFNGGEVVLPTRITCYCRHHKERKGFTIAFSLKTASGAIVASGATSPIMITDDHKTTMRPASSPADTSLDSISDVRPKKSSRQASRQRSPVPEAKPRRSTSGRSKAARGMVDSDEEAPSASTSRRQASAKPYDSESRPRKKPSSSAHRSPSFAMTPLTLSKPSSPTLRAQPDSNATVPEPRQLSGEWESALGLGGVDAVMSEQVRGVVVPSSSAPSPSPTPSYSGDWRSATSSPPLSPSSSTANSLDAFNSLFATLGRPDVANGRVLSPLQPSNSGSFNALYSNGDYSSRSAALVQQPTLVNWTVPGSSTAPTPPPPRISRLIPGEGPIHGGIEVTILGDNFVRDLTCVFGDSVAVRTHYWSANTLVCVLPPAANPGPVVVGFKGVPLNVEPGGGLQLFTYKDDSDRSLLELALQVVGLKMTGRLEDASAVALRIVGTAPNSAANTPPSSRGASPTDASDFASVFNAVASSPSMSRRATTRFALSNDGVGSSSSPLPLPSAAGQTRNFEGIVIKFLSLLDLDPYDIPGASPSLPPALPAISHTNAQGHTLLHLAVVLGFHRLAQFLIARDIDLDAQDRCGFSALHFAALYGRVNITRQLLDAGATIARNLAGRTALDIARQRDDVDVQNVIRRLRPNAARPMPILRPSPSRVAQTPRRSIVSNDENDNDECESSSFSDDDVTDDEDGGESEVSFHSSDDEETSDIERRLSRPVSRNASVVSLHYLLDAEADVHAEYEASISCAGATTESEEDDGDDEGEVTQDEKSLPPSTLGALASASSTWLANFKVKPSFGPPKSFNKLPKATGVTGVWEKMRPSTGFGLPLQMPDVMAFQASMPWIGGAKEAVVEGDEVERVAWGLGWRRDGPKSPPPMYTPSLEPVSTVVDQKVSPSTSKSFPTPLPPNKAAIQTKLKRKVGYAPEQISDSLEQTFVAHERKMRRLRDDRMLAFFWIPVLLIVSFWLVYSSYSSYIRPVALLALDTVVPFARRIRA